MRGRPRLLEPVCSVNVTMPEEFSGAVTGSIAARRGRVTAIQTRASGGVQLVRAMVPLADMFGYATELRTITGGRGLFDMRFEHYEPVPAEQAEEIVRRRRQERHA
jgi:elongation factor G